MWKAIETEEFSSWFDSLDDDAKEDIVVKIEVLKTLGPMLGRPLVDSLKGSRHSNLKELRVVSNGRPFRILCVRSETASSSSYRRQQGGR